MRNLKPAMIAQFRMSPESELIAITDELRAEATVESPAFRHRQDLALQLLQDEQDRRCVTDVATARILAGREAVARSMATDDLHDMLPDFEQVAAVCGIRPEQAQINKRIVVDELRRRGVPVESK